MRLWFRTLKFSRWICLLWTYFCSKHVVLIPNPKFLIHSSRIFFCPTFILTSPIKKLNCLFFFVMPLLLRGRILLPLSSYSWLKERILEQSKWHISVIVKVASLLIYMMYLSAPCFWFSFFFSLESLLRLFYRLVFPGYLKCFLRII